ncbi:DEAD/DEAH box helicase family protein [bacterium]|nr:MAG: DEAD/DEAH box helicase family protein [bacterium]
MGLTAKMRDFIVDVYELNPAFFEARLEKAKVWIPESQIMMKRVICEQSFAIVAPTGGGKTVMGQLTAVQLSQRCLFLVPMRRLAKRHQKLFEAIGSKLPTRVIIGETPVKKRIWDNHDERVIFATGQVVMEELKKNPELLKNFGHVIFDEFHNAATGTHAYSQIAVRAKMENLSRIGLSASPGNSKEKIGQAMKNCCLDRIYNIAMPVTRQIASIIHVEELPGKIIGRHRYLEELIQNEMTRCAYIFNYQARAKLGVSVFVDPKKHLGYKEIKKFREGLLEYMPNTAIGENYNLFEDKASVGQLLSTLREYEVWAHVYDLVHNESYEAFRNYYQETLVPSTAGYAIRMVKRGRMADLIDLTQNAVHPKMHLLLKMMESLQRRGMQAINFVANKATAMGCHAFLQTNNVTSNTMLGGGTMKGIDQEAALEAIEDKRVQILNATTVVREGFDLSVDCVINYNPPKSSIDLIQRSGRAGRHDKPAEIIYLATAEERVKIYAADRNVRRMKLAELSQFAGSLFPQEFNPEEVFLGDDLEIGEIEEEVYLPPVMAAGSQPNLF